LRSTAAYVFSSGWYEEKSMSRMNSLIRSMLSKMSRRCLSGSLKGNNCLPQDLILYRFFEPFGRGQIDSRSQQVGKSALEPSHRQQRIVFRLVEVSQQVDIGLGELSPLATDPKIARRSIPAAFNSASCARNLLMTSSRFMLSALTCIFAHLEQLRNVYLTSKLQRHPSRRDTRHQGWIGLSGLRLPMRSPMWQDTNRLPRAGNWPH